MSEIPTASGEPVLAWLERRTSVARVRDMEFDDPSLEYRRLFSEVWGTFLLVLVAAGGGVVGAEAFGGELTGQSGRIKTVITDQKVIAGIGNAYSDEILHVAKLSPFATASKLTDAQLAALHDAMISVLTDAVSRSVGQQAATLKGEKRSGLRVHARTGLPCPVCGDTVREVSFADKSFQYCPTCQTGGKVLADRRLSRLLK